MIFICPKCNSEYPSKVTCCPSCSFRPKRVDGFLSWLPTPNSNFDGFEPSYFENLFHAEAQNFWFRGRNRFILWALDKYFNGFNKLLEVGCGTGFVLQEIAKNYPSESLFGSEIFIEGLRFASKRLSAVKLSQMDARKLPYKNVFDVICAFDVIEHIEQDELALSSFYNAIKPGGGCIITVPQHKWLWSEIDVVACHQRRYSMRELHQKLERAGFKIVRSTSFVSSLLPVMALSRLSLRGKNLATLDLSKNGFGIHTFFNTLFFYMLVIEQKLVQHGLDLPFGGSRMVIARKI